jgi:hypothetical protein
MGSNVSINKRDPLMMQSGSGMVYGSPPPNNQGISLPLSNQGISGGITTSKINNIPNNNVNNDYPTIGRLPDKTIDLKNII